MTLIHTSCFGTTGLLETVYTVGSGGFRQLDAAATPQQRRHFTYAAGEGRCCESIGLDAACSLDDPESV